MSNRLAVCIAVGLAGGSALGACALLVGDVHGQLADGPGDSSVEGGPSRDSAASDGSSSPGDAGAETLEADGGGVTDADAGPDLDAFSACDAAANSCGWCGHSCNGALCTGGFCSPEVAFVGNTGLMSIDQGKIYFTQPPGGADAGVFVFDTSTQLVSPVVPGQDNPTLLVAHSPHLYWATSDGVIHRSLVDGGSAVTLATGQTPMCMAANAREVYWWDTTTGSVFGLPSGADAGTAVTTYSTTSPSTPGCVAADDTNRVMLGPAGLVQHNLGTGVTTTAMAPGTADPHHLVLAGPDVYFLVTAPDDAGAEHLQFAHVTTGTTTVTEFAPGYFMNPTIGLAALNGRLFWSFDPNVFGCDDPLCAGGVKQYSASTQFGQSLVLDPTWIYVASVGTGHVVRIAQ